MSPTAADAQHIALSVAQLTDTTTVIAAAAHAAGLVGTGDHDRLLANLTAARRDWADSGTRWAELAALQPRPALALHTAGIEVNAALQQIASTGPGWATTSVITSRVDVAETMRVLHRALAAAADTGHLLTEMASTDQALQAPARLMNTRTAAESRNSYDEHAWIAPSDHPNRPVPLTPPARAGLVAASERAAHATGAAATAAAALTERRDHARAVGSRLGRAQRLAVLARTAIYRTPPQTSRWR